MLSAQEQGQGVLWKKEDNWAPATLHDFQKDFARQQGSIFQQWVTASYRSVCVYTHCSVCLVLLVAEMNCVWFRSVNNIWFGCNRCFFQCWFYWSYSVLMYLSGIWMYVICCVCPASVCRLIYSVFCCVCPTSVCCQLFIALQTMAGPRWLFNCQKKS